MTAYLMFEHMERIYHWEGDKKPKKKKVICLFELQKKSETKYRERKITVEQWDDEKKS